MPELLTGWIMRNIMAGETLRDKPRIVNTCEARFNDAFEEWGNGGEPPLMTINPITKAPIEAICLSTPANTMGRVNGATIVLTRAGFGNAGPEMPDEMDENGAGAVECLYGMIIITPPNGSSDTSYTSEDKQLSRMTHAMVFSDGRVGCDTGFLQGDLLEQVSDAIQEASLIPTPEWYNTSEQDDE